MCVRGDMAHREILIYISIYFAKRDSKSSPKSIYHIKPFIDIGYNGLMGRILRQFASFVSFFSIILYQTDKELTKLSMFEVLYNSMAGA